jgi:anti-anti-sigma factor
MLTVNVENAGEEVVVLRVSGVLVLGAETARLRSCINGFRGEYREIWLDLAHVSKIDAAGLGLLAESYSTCRAQGTSLGLYNVSRKMCELLQLVRLFTIFGPCLVDKISKKAA